jgi:DNA-binding transcriptional regulator YiaG
MAKAPVTRKMPYAKTRSDCGLVAREELQPKLCHGSESIPRQIEEEKSQPRVSRDPEVETTLEEADTADAISVDDLRAKLKEVGLTQRDFARFSRTPYDTVRGWFRRTARIPGLATTILVMLSRDKTLAQTCRATGWEPLW